MAVHGGRERGHRLRPFLCVDIQTLRVLHIVPLQLPAKILGEVERHVVQRPLLVVFGVVVAVDRLEVNGGVGGVTCLAR